MNDRPSALVLVGHYNPFHHYPAFVVPVVQSPASDTLFLVYTRGGVSRYEALASGARYIPHSNGKQSDRGNLVFSPSVTGIFAITERMWVLYRVGEESALMASLFKQHPELRATVLALPAGQRVQILRSTDMTRELQQALLEGTDALAQASPDMAQSWAASFDTVHEGAILYSDIVDFSRLTEALQVDSYRRLCEFPDFWWSDHEVPGRSLRQMQTGDGTIVAIAGDDSRIDDGQNLLDLCVRFAHQWLGCLIDLKVSGVRVGLHWGRFQTVDIRGSHRLLGTGLNECERISSVADSGSAIASEVFVEQWVSRSGDDVRNRCFPSRSGRSIELCIKPDEVQAFRLLRGGGPKTPIPSKVLQMYEADLALRSALREAEAFFVLAVQSIAKSQTRSKLSPRLSIFAPHEGKLHCTTFRYNYHGDGIGQSKTAYALDLQKGGVFAAAYKDNAVMAVKGLPQRDPAVPESLEGYVGAFCGNSTTDPDVVRQFGRFARSFIVVPIALTNGPVDAVLCIDCLAPLTAIPDERLLGIGEAIKTWYSASLAALVRLRMPAVREKSSPEGALGASEGTPGEDSPSSSGPPQISAFPPISEIIASMQKTRVALRIEMREASRIRFVEDLKALEQGSASSFGSVFLSTELA